MKYISEQELVDLLANIADGERRIVAVAGPPGSGKSTLAERMETVLNAKTPGYAAVFPMDGYHFDDQVLIPRGLRPRKGAPETFDIEGFFHMLDRLGATRSKKSRCRSSIARWRLRGQGLALFHNRCAWFSLKAIISCWIGMGGTLSPSIRP
jgi:energy-coupling factor transporter ATP-binding protein EcfA2